jgi:hypothetical protein
MVQREVSLDHWSERPGPGEFQDIWMPHFDGEGKLYARDSVNHKVAFFDLSGKPVKEIK